MVVPGTFLLLRPMHKVATNRRLFLRRILFVQRENRGTTSDLEQFRLISYNFRIFLVVVSLNLFHRFAQHSTNFFKNS